MDVNDSYLDILLSYKTLASNPENHSTIMKDSVIVQFLAYCMDPPEEHLVKAALETLDLLIRNRDNHRFLRSTFGVLEALKSTAERKGELDEELVSLARYLYLVLDSSAPAYSTRSRKQSKVEQTEPSKVKLSSRVTTLHVIGLSQHNRSHVSDALIRLKGVVSVVVDAQHQRCVVRAAAKVTPQVLAEAIAEKTKLEAKLVVYNRLKEEELRDILAPPKDISGSEDTNDISLPEYLPEDESPVKDKAVLSFNKLRTNASIWLNAATSFLNDKLYW